jgi:hypothetical protein
MTAEPAPSPNAALFERTYDARRSRSPVAYVISAVEGFVDESAVKRYAELAGPAIEHFSGRFIVSNTWPPANFCGGRLRRISGGTPEDRRAS